MLVNHTDTGRNCLCRRTQCNRFVIDVNRALFLMMDPVDAFSDSGFPSTVFAQQAVNFAWQYVETEFVICDYLMEALCDVFNFQKWSQFRSSP